jgi:hypothetical protein
MEDRFMLQGDLVVVDQQTNLQWQRDASRDRMVWKDGFDYIAQLNEGKFAGHDDWRYPTKEELATLLEKEENRQTGLYINPAFGNQRNCWSSTEADHHRALYVDFYYGDVYKVEENYANYFIRAVRSKK